MIRAKQEESFENFVKIQKQLILSKGNDYSNEDRLSNFKLVGSMLGMDPKVYCTTHIANKAVRLSNLIGSGKTAMNESIKDTLVDMCNYAQLLNMLYEDEEVRLPENGN